MKRICVFLGSDKGALTEYQSSAKQLANELVQREIELVYGAAKVGLMGVLADAVLERGGRVIGVVPKGLTQKEIVHDKLTELRIVSSMHERKAQMAELADGFITLPRWDWHIGRNLRNSDLGTSWYSDIFLYICTILDIDEDQTVLIKLKSSEGVGISLYQHRFLELGFSRITKDSCL
jgi:hypothetical protein